MVSSWVNLFEKDTQCTSKMSSQEVQVFWGHPLPNACTLGLTLCRICTRRKTTISSSVLDQITSNKILSLPLGYPREGVYAFLAVRHRKRVCRPHRRGLLAGSVPDTEPQVSRSVSIAIPFKNVLSTPLGCSKSRMFLRVCTCVWGRPPPNVCMPPT
jgi:hypothetical protein